MDWEKPRIISTEDVLKQDQVCIFCGGLHDSATIEHCPSKSVFKKGERKNSHLFGACKPCNNEKSVDDNVAGYMILSTSSLIQDFSKEEARKLLSMHRYNPFPIIKTAFTERRKFSYGEKIIEGTHFLLNPKVSFSLNRWFSKVGSALWYLHTDTILPVSTTFEVQTFYSYDEIPEDVFGLIKCLPRKSCLFNNNTPHPEQFFYKFHLEEGYGVFVVTVRNSVCAIIQVDTTGLDFRGTGLSGHFYTSTEGIKPQGRRRDWGDIHPRVIERTSELRSSTSLLDPSS